MLKFLEGTKTYLHFTSFLNIDMTQVVEILPHARPTLACFTQSRSWLLMTWRCKEPGYQQSWYWPNWTEITQSRHAKGYTLRLKWNGHCFADDIFMLIFSNKIVWYLIKILLKIIPKGPFIYSPLLIQIMAWCRLGDKPLSEALVVQFAHACMRP